MQRIREYNTLFLDRDGVINVRLVDDYVKTWSDFSFEKDVKEAMQIFAKKFKTIVVVSNQQGVGKGLMSQQTLDDIHDKMKQEVQNAGGRIDGIYTCTALKNAHCFARKPQVGMALRARKEFSSIRFKGSVMVGDASTDMYFGKRLGMQTIFLSGNISQARQYYKWIDKRFLSLIEYAKYLENEDKK
jgi:histidinol-phosphate phosphatase family domain/HAD-superfamily hydrolase, subfamily IIIA